MHLRRTCVWTGLVSLDWYSTSFPGLFFLRKWEKVLGTRLWSYSVATKTSKHQSADVHTRVKMKHYFRVHSSSQKVGSYPIEVSIIWGRGIHSCRRGSEVRLSFASMTCFRRNLAQEDNLLHYSLTAWTKQTLKWKYSSAFEVALFHPFVRLSYLKRLSSIRKITACNGSAE